MKLTNELEKNSTAVTEEPVTIVMTTEALEVQFLLLYSVLQREVKEIGRDLYTDMWFVQYINDLEEEVNSKLVTFILDKNKVIHNGGK